MKQWWVRTVGVRSITYAEVWRELRRKRGRYTRTPVGFGRLWRDLARATGWLIRPLMMLSIPGYGMPPLTVWEER
jgi:hypothetical protein